MSPFPAYRAGYQVWMVWCWAWILKEEAKIDGKGKSWEINNQTAEWRCWCAIVNGVPFVPNPGMEYLVTFVNTTALAAEMFVFRRSGTLCEARVAAGQGCSGVQTGPGGMRGRAFQARPRSIHCGLSAFLLPFRHWASVFFVPLAWAPSTCSQQRLPGCPVLAQACRQQELGTTTQPTFRDCGTRRLVCREKVHYK